MSQPYETSSAPPPLPPGAVPVISYATPAGSAPAGGAWRDGPKLVMHKAGHLHDACVKCGQPPQKWLKRNLVWYPPIAYIGLLAGILPFAIIALIMQKKATIIVPLCADHLRKRLHGILIGWCVVLASFAVMIGGPMMLNQPILILVGLIILIIGAYMAQSAAQPLKPAKIDDQYAYLKGAGEPFLSHLSPIN